MEIADRKKYHPSFVKFWIIAIVVLSAFLYSVPVYAKEPLLVIRIEGKDYEQALKGIRQETGEEFLINEMIVTQNATVSQLNATMREISPKLVVLMDNISISLYKKYQTASDSSVPSVSLMASFMDIAIDGMNNAVAIFYEVPLVTSMMNLRTVMPDVKLTRVGVVHRNNITDQYVRINQNYCQKEHIELIPYPISNTSDMVSELKKGLETLDRKEKIDALWVLNDSILINEELLGKVWLPFTEKFKKPVIVGVEVLVQPKLNFGTFAVIPDHVELGVQAAELIFGMKKKNWHTGNSRVEPPRSVYTILNLDQAQGLFQVRKEQLNYVDKILK